MSLYASLAFHPTNHGSTLSRVLLLESKCQLAFLIVQHLKIKLHNAETGSKATIVPEQHYVLTTQYAGILQKESIMRDGYI